MNPLKALPLLLVAALLIGCSDTRVPVGTPHTLDSSLLIKGGANFHGALNLTCADCHNVAIFCSTCHFGPSGARVPPGSSWTHGRASHSAAEEVAQSAVCVSCHQIKMLLSGAPENSSCTGCHDGNFTVHALPYGDAHRAAAHTDLLPCRSCHGSGGTNFSGGVAETACATCHTAAKAHPTDWQGAGTYSHRTAGNKENACPVCHDGQMGRSAPLPAAPSCFSANFTNADGQARTCHANGFRPHADPFADPALHGAPAKADLVYCQGCHGTPGTTAFNGGSAGVACSSCHAAAKAHPTDWQGSGTYSHRNAGKLSTVCAVCHDYTNGRTPPLPEAPSCYSANFTNTDGQARTCHSAGPQGHVKGQAWLDKKSATFHGDSTLTCSDCHSVNTYCSTCHFGPTGSKSPIGSGWVHRRSGHDDYSVYINVCNTCHTLNRTYGNGPGACHNCHD